MQLLPTASSKSYASLLKAGAHGKQSRTRNCISLVKKPDLASNITRLMNIKRIKDLLTKSPHITNLLKIEIMHKIERNICVELMMHEDPTIYLRQIIEEYTTKYNKSWVQRVTTQQKQILMEI